MNYIVAKSKIPGVASKIVKIPSYGAPMTEAQKVEVLGRMAQKMREEAAALAAAAAAAAAADVSAGVISDVSAGSAE
jgi:hypothetical protein